VNAYAGSTRAVTHLTGELAGDHPSFDPTDPLTADDVPSIVSTPIGAYSTVTGVISYGQDVHELWQTRDQIYSYYGQ